MTSPFDDLRIIDLSDRLSGAFAARLFGDFGADVVLVERPEGHPLRHEPPFKDDQAGLDRSPVHAYVNWNKRSMVCQSADEMGDLIATADVVVTTQDPIAGSSLDGPLGRMASSAVHLSVTPHGLDSPLSGVPGNNLTTSARTGWSYINRLENEAPLQMPRHQSGYVGGVTGFIAAAAALRRRDHGDAAERVDVSEMEAFALTVHPWGIASIYRNDGFCNGPTGARPRGEPGPLWNLADGRMHFSIGDFHNWTQAMEAMGLPELGTRDDLIPDIGRHSLDLTEVSIRMARALPNHERWTVFHALAELRCVVGVMQDIGDIVEDKQLNARGFLIETDVNGERVRSAGAPAIVSPSPWKVSRHAPRLDQHVDEIRSESSGSLPASTQQTSSRFASLTEHELAEGPLSGIRVLSFGQAWSGTFATEVLSLLGADVVQVGAIHRPDVWRRVRDQVPDGLVDPSRTQHPLNTQGLYNSVNLNKREITLDLRKPAGRDLLWRLLPRFDILAENFRPTVIPSWGITLEKLHEIRPGMIWASISGYGTSGPYREYPANGATTEAMSGVSSLHGYKGDPGMNTGGLYPDPVSGYFLIAALMAALRHRDRTGLAQRIDLSMMEALTTVCGDAVIEYDATGRVPKPIGNRHPRFAPHYTYAATNRQWLSLAVESETAWQSLVSHIGDVRLREPQFATMESRKMYEIQLDAIIAEWCRGQDASDAEAALGAIDVAAARVVPLYELYSRPDPSFRKSGFVSRVDHPETGPTWLPGRPWRFSSAAASPLRASPCIGQHSREVLCGELELSDAEYDSLVQQGVTGTLDDHVAIS